MVLFAYFTPRAQQTESAMDDQLVPFVGKTLKRFLVMTGLLVVAQNMGYSISGLLASLGIGGIAIAMAMVAATDDEVGHPPLELLFTTDEETGLTGATSLQPGFIKGKQLLNIDSEDEGVFTVGCAGGEDARLLLPFVTDESLPTHSVFKLVGGGMAGGHSGIDIIEGRANALKLLDGGIPDISKKNDGSSSPVRGGTE
mgnify:CR=1 FL=1